MARYFTRPRAVIVPERLVGDERCFSHDPLLRDLDVPDHEATDTGLVDRRGDSIMRAPNPVGFIWDDGEAGAG